MRVFRERMLAAKKGGALIMCPARFERATCGFMVIRVRC